MTVRKVVGTIIIIFIIYAIWTSPVESGNVASNGWDQIQHGLTSIVKFFNTMLKNNN